MENFLFLAHVEEDSLLAKASLEALQIAVTTVNALSGSTLTVGLIGENVNKAAEQIGSCGARRFVSVAGPDFAISRYSSDALAIEAIARAVKPTVVIAAGTSRFARVLPSLAARLEGYVDTHAAELVTEDAKLAIKRWYYRQRMEAVLERSERPWIILVDPGSAQAWSGEAKSVLLDSLSLDLPLACRRTTVSGFRAPVSDEQTIRPDAELLLVAGAGWTKKQEDGQLHAEDARGLILDFLQKSKASLGGSKSIVDLDSECRSTFNFMTHLNQVGQTGATPRHAKGLATCCHGEEPHVVGWRFINERRAINLDPNCGWARGKADVVYIADAFKVMAKVNELLS